MWAKEFREVRCPTHARTQPKHSVYTSRIRLHSLSTRVATPEITPPSFTHPTASLFASARRVKDDLTAWFHHHSTASAAAVSDRTADLNMSAATRLAATSDHDAHHHTPPNVQHSTSLLPFTMVANNSELVYASLLSDLSNLAYNVGLITDSILQARHNLRLIATSEGCFLMPQNQPHPATPALVTQETSSHSTPSTSDASSTLTSTKQTPTLVSHSESTDHPQRPWFQSSHEHVASPHSTSFSPDSHDSDFLAINPHQAVGAALLMAAAFTRSVENLSSAAQISHASSVVGQGSSRTQPAIMECAPAPPCAWFIADDEVTKVRHFVIQGSTNMEHWAINLHFQPVLFEDDKSGVRIHHGVYDAAVKLFTQFVPLVEEHLASSPHATVAFTGHSLGGSLATVVMLLMVSRGVLSPSAASPVFTYGAPSVFCQQLETHPTPPAPPPSPSPPSHRHVTSHLTDSPATPSFEPKDFTVTAVPASVEKPWAPRGLLAHLGLSEDHIVNVIMHRDIVPRAFVCDYTQMASVLRMWWPTFKTHASLNDSTLSHKSIYQFLGRVAVLLPDPSQPFVMGGDHRHPMLPDVPALYKLVEQHDVLGCSGHDYDGIYDDAAGGEGYVRGWELLIAAEEAAAQAAAAPEQTSAAAPVINGCSIHGRGGDMHGTLLAFMNTPHPLKTLADYGSYGPNGVISRFHNPDHYTLALTGLLALQYPAPAKIAHITGAWR